MPRSPVIRSREHFYHLTSRSNNKERFFLPIDQVWQIFIKELRRLQLEFAIEIGAFVLMSNHFHLLLRSPQEDIDRVMYFLMKRVTLRMQKSSERINKIFGGRYKGSVIHDELYLANAWKYVFRNPVAAGICERAENYPYSTFLWSLDVHTAAPLRHLRFDEILPHDTLSARDIVAWVNSAYSEEQSQNLSSSLRRARATWSKDRSTGREMIIPIPNAASLT